MSFSKSKEPIMKRELTIISALLVALAASPSSAEEGKPNIIFFFADDLGYADQYGNPTAEQIEKINGRYFEKRK